MIGAMWAWLRRHTQLVDFLLMSPLLVVAILSGPAIAGNRGVADVGRLGYGALSLALVLPLIWRRRAPRTVFLVIMFVEFAQWSVQIPLLPADLAIFVALYTVAAETAFRWGVAAALITMAGATMEIVQQETSGWSERKDFLIFCALFVGGIWILGIYIHTRRAYLRSLEERAARLERERDNEVQVAMAAERARIARELHDVVAHNVSVIVVQSDGAAYAIDNEPERAKRALETISMTGRTALTEMRRLLGVLRDDDATGPYAPQPGVEQLNDLVEQIRESGLPLEFTVEGVPSQMSEGLQLTIFRIVQEALTNTLKHGGPRATAQVGLHYGDDAVELSVRDDGRGTAAGNDGRGHGLLGMRERVAVYGGSVRAGPRAGGGFEVIARLPMNEAGARTSGASG